ncbi:MAG: DNA repair protein RadA [Deltaproteobacteria bacterium]|nr:DNA repair protein RadA [Deltaproteobacteria bacterium]
MSKPKTIFVCQNCGATYPKWMGRCPECNSWNTIVEEIVKDEKKSKVSFPGPPVFPIHEIEKNRKRRIKTGIEELDRVLGGGVVSGSVVLIGGEPGIGKSTLILQALASLANNNIEVVYITGEESLDQIRMRAERIGVISSNVKVASETNLNLIFSLLDSESPQISAIDSIQTLLCDEITSAPGSISQVRESAARLVRYAKDKKIALFFIGHITKEGAIAGPKLLEHMVDTVLYFETSPGIPYRILRTAKNRFGSANEIGVFEMGDKGLKEIISPSEIFLSQRASHASGSVVVSCIEGTRPILVEVQALVSPSKTAMPRRQGVGVDPNRLSLMVAVLEKKLGINLMDQDIFLNVAGGVRVDEPAVDLAIAGSILSSFFDRLVDSKTVILGEVGLAGEIRAINQIEIRIMEAKRIGFSRFILPEGNREKLKFTPDDQFLFVSDIKQFIEVLF